MLIVIAIIAILASLVTPALQGILGTGGRVGGVNTAAAVFEQARLAALESGVTAYVGFPGDSANITNRFSHLIVLREPRSDETAGLVAVTRWQKLPQGVFYEGSTNFASVATNKTIPTRTVPPLPGENPPTQLKVIPFNRFGQLVPSGQVVSLRLGEKADPTGSWVRSDANYFEMTVQPLTGRTVVEDKSGKL